MKKIGIQYSKSSVNSPCRPNCIRRCVGCRGACEDWKKYETEKATEMWDMRNKAKHKEIIMEYETRRIKRLFGKETGAL